MADAWKALHAELSLWSSPINLWWRDDDAVADTAALRHLLDIQAQGRYLPLHLAAIPQQLEPSLPALLANTTRVWILQHGFDHQSYANPGQKKYELGGQLDREALRCRLARGRSLLREAFAERYLDVLVPPWNRYDRQARDIMHDLGYQAVSGFGLRAKRPASIAQISTHVDIVNWQAKRFVGTDSCLREITEKIRNRRLGRCDHAEPLGLLTHHLDHDQACWDFLHRFVSEFAEHPRVQWRKVDDLLELPGCTPRINNTAAKLAPKHTTHSDR